MSRRIALPGADELFRSTGDATRPASAPAAPSPAAPLADESAPRTALTVAPEPVADLPVGDDHSGLAEAAQAVRPAARRRPRALADRRPSGRESHDEKITVYLSAEELLDLEHARLGLRADHGLPVDRGRIVREALAVVLADFDAKGDASILVRRLRGR